MTHYPVAEVRSGEGEILQPAKELFSSDIIFRFSNLKGGQGEFLGYVRRYWLLDDIGTVWDSQSFPFRSEENTFISFNPRHEGLYRIRIEMRRVVLRHSYLIYQVVDESNISEPFFII
ncbi:MAG: hypothetical protein F6K21_05560 [Symploca sp. SIO2D2]|nr:hypothetical protein [Symploca sp. SIO2D2]